MGKRKPAQLTPPRYRVLALSAVVLRDELEFGEDQDWIDQAAACEALAVTDRTVRNWCEIGLPHRPGPHGKPLYPYPDIRVWAECYREKAEYAQRYKRPGPTRLTMLEALNWDEIQRADGFGDNYVVVPTDLTAPGRARLLRIAADGIADVEGETLDADEAWLAAHAPQVPRDYLRLDMGWPAKPGTAQEGAA